MTRHSGWLALPIVAALVSVPAQRADAQLVSFGVVAGASLSTFTSDRVTDIKNNTGFLAGAFVRVGALGFAVQPGVFYMTKGAKFDDVGQGGGNTKLDYIEIPVVIRLSLPMHLYVGAGLAIGFKLGCKISLDTEQRQPGLRVTRPQRRPARNPPSTAGSPRPGSTSASSLSEGGLTSAYRMPRKPSIAAPYRTPISGREPSPSLQQFGSSKETATSKT